MEEVLQTVFEKLNLMKDQVNVAQVFGTPEKVGDITLIPVAEVVFGFGVGAGGVSDHMAIQIEPDAQSEDAASATSAEAALESEEAAGAGGGGGGRVRPIAYIEVGPDGARVKAITDDQKIALAGILLSVWAVGWVGLVLKTLFAPRRH